MVHDVVVVGGGIVGAATARALLRRRPGSDVVLLEKEDDVARHQSGRNSGVVHAGVYYAPGSLKARLCRAGERATKELCDEHDVPYRVPGKLVVATHHGELGRLRDLADRARLNGLRVERVDAGRLRELEPDVRGVAALLVPSTGVVDYRRVTRALVADVRAAGGALEAGVAVDGIREEGAQVVVSAGERVWRTRLLVVCAGLQADRLARLGGLAADFRVVPFRGEYHRLPDGRAGLVRHLVYPVPDPALPFLGVHLTPGVDGTVTVGPNAVLGGAREGYRKGSLDRRDVLDWATYPGTWHLARRHLRTGAAELRDSLWRRGYLERCRRYVPDLTLADLRPHPAGVRAQAVLRDGTLVHDFLLERTDRQLHVCNAPSPAATSALPIAEEVVDRLLGPAARGASGR
ncbi:L-2-hydroxyglutarate oxidase [Thalassiella azotivora]